MAEDDKTATPTVTMALPGLARLAQPAGQRNDRDGSGKEDRQMLLGRQVFQANGYRYAEQQPVEHVLELHSGRGYVASRCKRLNPRMLKV